MINIKYDHIITVFTVSSFSFQANGSQHIYCAVSKVENNTRDVIRVMYVFTVMVRCSEGCVTATEYASSDVFNFTIYMGLPVWIWVKHIIRKSLEFP